MGKHDKKGKHEGPRKKEPSKPGRHTRKPAPPENCFACDVMMHNACIKNDTCKCYRDHPRDH